MAKFRMEKDALGEMRVPHDALYGASTARALENFQVSGQPMPHEFIEALVILKRLSSKTNWDLGLLDKRIASAVISACDKILTGEARNQFGIDVFQTGSGTSSNMNVNEVIANLANLSLGSPLGVKAPVHPNDHVNLGQSSNDIFPSAIHVALVLEIEKRLLPALVSLENTLILKTKAFIGIEKVGRTHLQDASPLTLGEEFSGWAEQATKSIVRLKKAETHCLELPVGGTAVGNGISTHSTFAKRVCELLRSETGLQFIEAKNHFEAQGARDALVELGSTLKVVAVSLTKIACDLRLISSGPRCGIGEITLPAVQPGSSIMPGKVNPVMIESLLQVCAYVVGVDATVSWAGAMGQLELNAMMPVMGFGLLQSIQWLANAIQSFSDKCVTGISVNRDKLKKQLDLNLMQVTKLVSELGYDKAAELANYALSQDLSVAEALTAKLSKKEAMRLLKKLKG